MNVLTNIIARILFAVPLIVFSSFHFMNANEMAGMAPFGGVFIVYLTGVALLAGAIAILINKMGSLAALLLGIFFILTATTVHLPNVINGDQTAMGTMLKDLALAGGAWFISGGLKGSEESKEPSGAHETGESSELGGSSETEGFKQSE